MEGLKKIFFKKWNLIITEFLKSELHCMNHYLGFVMFGSRERDGAEEKMSEMWE